MKHLLLLPAFALMSASAASAQCPGNDLFDNTREADAISLNPGYNFRQNFSIVGVGGANFGAYDAGNDFFTFTLGPNRSAQIDLDFDFSESALYFQVYGPSGFIAGTDPNTQVASMYFSNSSSTTTQFLLRISSGASFQGCGDYTLTVDGEVCPGDDQVFEDNDDCATATQLTGIPSQQPSIQSLAILDGDDDWFEVDVDPGESLDAMIFFEHARADVDLQLFNLTSGCGGSAIGTSQTTTDDEFLSYTNGTSSTATIGIRVYWYSGEPCNDYELAYEIISVPDDIYEENDSICTANPTFGIGYEPGLLVYDADSDFYEFGIGQNGQFTFAIDFDNAAGDLDLRLWDITSSCSTATLVSSSTSTSNFETVVAEALIPGVSRFVLEVYYYPSDGGGNTYALTAAKSVIGQAGGAVCGGEPNSTGNVGRLYSQGTDSISANDLRLVSEDLPTNSFGYYLASKPYGFVANPSGSAGNLCIAGAPIGRYVGPGQIQNSGANGAVGLDVDWSTVPQPSGPVAAASGDTWFFQLWYRDSTSGGGVTSNFSEAMRVRTTL